MLIFNIKIPLVDWQNFVLYNIIPIPIHINNTQFAYVQTTYDFIAINPSKEYYTTFTSIHDQLNWNQIRSMIRYIFKRYKIKIVIFVNTVYSEEEKRNIIKEFHGTPLECHLGMSWTIKKNRKHHTWKGLKSDVKEYIQSCTSCQINKSSNHKIQQLMVTNLLMQLNNLYMLCSAILRYSSPPKCIII